MKRGPGPQRKTPLSSSSELSRGSGLARGQGLQRSAPMPRSPPDAAGKPKRAGKARPARDISPKRRQLVYDRDEGCVRCGRDVGPGQRQCHHRVARGMGGREDHDRPSALITVCGTSSTDPGSCHMAIETYRIRAQAAGFLVPAGTDPLTWPVHHARHGWVLLDDIGGFVPTAGVGDAG